MHKVYLAGKIAKLDWRHFLFEISDVIDETDENTATRGNFEYSGPYFMSCDHGCYHGEMTHGRGTGTTAACFTTYTEPRSFTAHRCLKWIRQSDYMFVWIDSTEAFGTLVEIGYAKGVGVPVFVAIDENIVDEKMVKEQWFSHTIADMVLTADNIQHAWDYFEDWVTDGGEDEPEEQNHQACLICGKQEDKHTIEQAKYCSQKLWQMMKALSKK